MIRTEVLRRRVATLNNDVADAHCVLSNGGGGDGNSNRPVGRALHHRLPLAIFADKGAAGGRHADVVVFIATGRLAGAPVLTRTVGTSRPGGNDGNFFFLLFLIVRYRCRKTRVAASLHTRVSDVAIGRRIATAPTREQIKTAAKHSVAVRHLERHCTLTRDPTGGTDRRRGRRGDARAGRVNSRRTGASFVVKSVGVIGTSLRVEIGANVGDFVDGVILHRAVEFTVTVIVDAMAVDILWMLIGPKGVATLGGALAVRLAREPKCQVDKQNKNEHNVQTQNKNLKSD